MGITRDGSLGDTTQAVWSNHPRELAAVLRNLKRYFDTLQQEVNPLNITYGFMHFEGMGVVAIDQKGGGNGLAQTRLYVYPDADTNTLYLITLGDKTSRKIDVKDCHTFVKFLQEQKQPLHPNAQEAIEDGTQEGEDKAGNGTEDSGKEVR